MLLNCFAFSIAVVAFIQPYIIIHLLSDESMNLKELTCFNVESQSDLFSKRPEVPDSSSFTADFIDFKFNLAFCVNSSDSHCTCCSSYSGKIDLASIGLFQGCQLWADSNSEKLVYL